MRWITELVEGVDISLGACLSSYRVFFPLFEYLYRGKLADLGL